MESERPLVSLPESVSVLRDEYSNSPNFLAQIDSLVKQGYKTIIRAKGRRCISLDVHTRFTDYLFR